MKIVCFVFMIVCACCRPLVADTNSVSSSLATETKVEDCKSEAVQEKKKHGIGHKILFYIPNRVLDIVDIFRLRAKVGPGLAANVQVTSFASFYGGSHNVVYAGLPGPRMSMKKPRPWGREKQKGIVFFGIDATDDSMLQPEHSKTEVGFGFHLLVIGVDAGIDPVEIGDFVAGIIGLDPKGDDK